LSTHQWIGEPKHQIFADPQLMMSAEFWWIWNAYENYIFIIFIFISFLFLLEHLFMGLSLLSLESYNKKKKDQWIPKIIDLCRHKKSTAAAQSLDYYSWEISFLLL